MAELTDKQIAIASISHEDGVSDLIGMPKMLFATALYFERNGDQATGFIYLEKAIASESRNRQP